MLKPSLKLQRLNLVYVIKFKVMVMINTSKRYLTSSTLKTLLRQMNCQFSFSLLSFILKLLYVFRYNLQALCLPSDQGKRNKDRKSSSSSSSSSSDDSKKTKKLKVSFGVKTSGINPALISSWITHILKRALPVLCA